ncbi:unnamed protein product, partial [Closterium sp. Yama58-4]
MALLALVCSAARLQPSQVAVLQECEAVWNMTGSGWTAGGDCMLPHSIVQCNAEGMITRLYLTGINLNGTIPTSIANLTALTLFKLDDSNVRGPLPTALSHLTRLAELTLHMNNLTGPISILHHFSFLTYLDLSDNQFDGPVPSSISQLSLLTHINLKSTKIAGPIPSTISALHKLETS